jgi:hypothetical protein
LQQQNLNLQHQRIAKGQKFQHSIGSTGDILGSLC